MGFCILYPFVEVKTGRFKKVLVLFESKVSKWVEMSCFSKKIILLLIWVFVFGSVKIEVLKE